MGRGLRTVVHHRRMDARIVENLYDASICASRRKNRWHHKDCRLAWRARTRREVRDGPKWGRSHAALL